jgi:hypothetical protein
MSICSAFYACPPLLRFNFYIGYWVLDIGNFMIWFIRRRHGSSAYGDLILPPRLREKGEQESG